MVKNGSFTIPLELYKIEIFNHIIIKERGKSSLKRKKGKKGTLSTPSQTTLFQYTNTW